ncbi:transmembrane protein [Perilla frutescens var. frutescens]|nr:transmembrane protein [Perilla frutescens var. frutescens]
MAVSLNSVISFNPNTNYQQGRRDNVGVLLQKIPCITSLSGPVGLRQSTAGKKSRSYLIAAGGDNVATETTDKDSKSVEGSYSIDGPSDNVSDVTSSEINDKIQSSVASPVSEASNGAISSTDVNQEASAAKSSSTVKRAPLTARERLRAARVLNRYTDTKPTKAALGSRLLDALQESDKGKRRPGLPQAPMNLFDDSKRGMPKQGLTFDLPGGMDAFFIAVSFVLISTVMFATTYIVWKVGAIHFNE